MALAQLISCSAPCMVLQSGCSVQALHWWLMMTAMATPELASEKARGSEKSGGGFHYKNCKILRFTEMV